MTFLALLIAPNGTSFRWTSAGHDPPLLYNAEQDTFHEPSGGGIPLGILADQEYEEYDCELGPRKSILVIGTDGIWETANPDKELYGKERLRDLIHRHREDTADQIGTAIIEELNAFRQSDRPLDDVTLIVIKRK